MADYSIYVHLPYCKSRCRYCDFFSTVTEPIPFAAYRQALIAEWQRRRFAAPHLDKLTSVYLGGGTPSLWPAEELAALLKAFLLQGDEEVTVEVNPKDPDDKWFARLIGAGANRFSIGAQAMDDARLRFLGRRHLSADNRFAVGAALASGARSVSADLIFGTPGHTVEHWQQELEAIVALGVHHVSAYQLTIAEGTPLLQRREAGEIVSEGEEETARIYRAARRTLAAHGFKQYEVSNFAPKKYRSIHNLRYWQGGEYLGLGAGAHGFLLSDEQPTRYGNSTDVDAYIQDALSSDTPLKTHLGIAGFTEQLSLLDHAREKMMLGLRTATGAPFDEILQTLPRALRITWQNEAEQLIKNRLVKLRNGQISPTAKGMIRADGMAERFF